MNMHTHARCALKMGKSDIKDDVFRREFASCARTSPKGLNEGKYVPPAEPEDATETYANVSYAVADAGIWLHGYDNTRKPLVGGSDQPWSVTNARGSDLLSYLLSWIRRLFTTHQMLTTVILVMDKSCFMPPPKRYTQKKRSNDLGKQLAQRKLQPIVVSDGDAVDTFVAMNLQLKPWIAIRENRTAYRQATAELLDLIIENYAPPAGCRLIVDCLDRCVAAPRTIDDWMCSERVQLTDYAQAVVERAREALRGNAKWREHTRTIADELGHAGHIKSVPVCIEASNDGMRYAPFTLENATNTCGEADLCIPFWLTHMQEATQHTTLAGERLVGEVIDPNGFIAEFYEPEEIERHNRLVAAQSARPNPLPLAEQRRAARRAARQEDEQGNALVADIYADIGAAAPAKEKLTALLGRELSPDNPCRDPNRALVISSDTDFLSLLTVWYAQFVYECELRGVPLQYCVDNAPLLSTGPCWVTRYGWMRSFEDDYYQPPPKPSKKQLEAEAEARSGRGTWQQLPAKAKLEAHEVWDIAKIGARLRRLARAGMEAERGGDENNNDDDDEDAGRQNARMAKYQRYIEQAAAFATFCASCENDFLDGLYYVNRRDMFQAFLMSGFGLVKYNHALGFGVIDAAHYRRYIALCYYNSLANANGQKNKPGAPPEEFSWRDLDTLLHLKYKGPDAERKCLPGERRLYLMYTRTQWWLSYAMCAHRDITLLLDDSAWGWRPGTTEEFV